MTASGSYVIKGGDPNHEHKWEHGYLSGPRLVLAVCRCGAESVAAEEFNRLHEIAKAADAVARLHYPCKCYQAECPHGQLIKALGWSEKASHSTTFKGER